MHVQLGLHQNLGCTKMMRTSYAHGKDDRYFTENNIKILIFLKSITNFLFTFKYIL